MVGGKKRKLTEGTTKNANKKRKKVVKKLTKKGAKKGSGKNASKKKTPKKSKKTNVQKRKPKSVKKTTISGKVFEIGEPISIDELFNREDGIQDENKIISELDLEIKKNLPREPKGNDEEEKIEMAGGEILIDKSEMKAEVMEEEKPETVDADAMEVDEEKAEDAVPEPIVVQEIPSPPTKDEEEAVPDAVEKEKPKEPVPSGGAILEIEEEDPLADKKINSLTVKVLRKECTARGLNEKGLKRELVARLEKYLEQKRVRIEAQKQSKLSAVVDSEEEMKDVTPVAAGFPSSNQILPEGMDGEDGYIFYTGNKKIHQWRTSVAEERQIIYKFQLRIIDIMIAQLKIETYDHTTEFACVKFLDKYRDPWGRKIDRRRNTVLQIQRRVSERVSEANKFQRNLSTVKLLWWIDVPTTVKQYFRWEQKRIINFGNYINNVLQKFRKFYIVFEV